MLNDAEKQTGGVFCLFRPFQRWLIHLFLLQYVCLHGLKYLFLKQGISSLSKSRKRFIRRGFYSKQFHFRQAWRLSFLIRLFRPTNYWHHTAKEKTSRKTFFTLYLNFFWSLTKSRPKLIGAKPKVSFERPQARVLMSTSIHIHISLPRIKLEETWIVVINKTMSF